MKKWLMVLAAGALLGTQAAAQVPADEAAPLTGFDAYVRHVMDQWQVPGLAVAIVKDGKVVLARGYGVREVGKPDQVDGATLFDIGSNTKAFTAAALGTLVATGKLDWDSRVVDYVKPFQLSSPYVTQSITLRDLLTHRSGYCDPGMWYTSDDSDVIVRLRYQQPEYGFRAQFCYNNMLYLTASRFIPTVTGETWNRYVAEHVFAPLGMDHTVTTAAEVAAASDVATPHGVMDGKVVAIRPYWAHDMDIISPVGGINSSADDMSHWMLMLLADGQYDGRTVLDSSTVRAMETPQMLIQASSGVGREIRTWLPGSAFYTYGLGLFIQTYAGHTLVWHAGDIDGMASAVALVPDERLGVVVLSNMNQSDARFGIVQRVLNAYLGLPPGGISDTLLAMTQRARKAGQAAAERLASTRDSTGHPPHPLSSYAGVYEDQLDGTVRVGMEDGHLVLRLGNLDFVGDLEYWHDDTFRVTWRYRYRGTEYVTFDLDDLGQPTRLSMGRGSRGFERVRARGGRSGGGG
jgi:CubicO group peptidase (beta-lactamase class C family)